VFFDDRLHEPALIDGMKKQSLCAACSRGPSGLLGHEDLFSQSMDASQLQFKCRACGHTWARLYKGVGTIEWAEARANAGSPLPGRRDL
jgi:hypothetical protein